MDKSTLNMDEAAALLGVTRRSIYRMIHDNRLPVIFGKRGWRVSREAVEKLRDVAK